MGERYNEAIQAAAHTAPNPRTWDEAEPGEIWELTEPGGISRLWVKEEHLWRSAYLTRTVYWSAKNAASGCRTDLTLDDCRQRLNDDDDYLVLAEDMMSAALPHIKAVVASEALREAAEEIKQELGSKTNPGIGWVAKWLHNKADRIVEEEA